MFTLMRGFVDQKKTLVLSAQIHLCHSQRIYKYSNRNKYIELCSYKFVYMLRLSTPVLLSYSFSDMYVWRVQGELYT